MAALVAILCSIGATAILWLVRVCHGSVSLNHMLYQLSQESDRIRCDEIRGVDYVGDDFVAPREQTLQRRFVIFTAEVGDENNVMEVYPGLGRIEFPGIYLVRRRVNGEVLDYSTYSHEDIRAFLRREDLISRLPEQARHPHLAA